MADKSTIKAGHKLLRSVVDSGDYSKLASIDRSLLQDDEIPLLDDILTHYSTYGVLPSVEALAIKGFQLPPAPESFSFYYDRLKERSLYAIVLEGINNANHYLRLNDIRQAATSYLETAKKLADPSCKDDSVLLEHAADYVRKDYSAQLACPKRRISFGWDAVDHATGGMRGGNLYVMAGRPSTGKSYLSMYTAIRASEAGNKVLYITMELSLEEITRRWLSVMAGINPRSFAQGQLDLWSVQRLDEALDSIQSSGNVYLMSGDLRKTTSDVGAQVQKHSPDLIVVDAAYFLTSSRATQRMSRWESLTAVMEDLKSISLSFDRPVLITVQLNREHRKGFKKDVDTAVIAGTDAIGQIASVIISLTVPGEPPNESRRQLEMTKVRDGMTGGKLQINYTFAPMDFSQVPDETPDEVMNSINAML